MTKENQTKQPVVAEATVSVAMTDGRSAFETFVKTSTSQNIARDQNGFYTDEVTYDWWKVWQAAILSRAQDAQAVRNAALEESVQPIREALALMNSMIACGEDHTETSRAVLAKAFAAIRALQSAPAQPVERPDAVELPPLPDEQLLATELAGHVLEAYAYTADQMREYALAALSQVRGKAQEPVAWANWRVGTKSYVPYRTKDEAIACVRQSRISATQEGPYKVVDLYADDPQVRGKALVPLVPNKAMREVMESDDWQWEDLLAAAGAVTEEQYSDIAAAAPQVAPAVPDEWRESLALTVERLNDDAEMHDRSGNNSTAEDRRARAYEITQMLAATSVAAPIMHGESKAAYERGFDDGFILGTEKTRSKSSKAGSAESEKEQG